jgi:hypothetical protein
MCSKENTHACIDVARSEILCFSGAYSLIKPLVDEPVSTNLPSSLVRLLTHHKIDATKEDDKRVKIDALVSLHKYS